MTTSQLKEIIKIWFDSVVAIDNLLLEDAHKEFSLVSSVGFGHDAKKDENIRADFENVRGSAQQNDFIATIEQHIVTKEALFYKVLERIC